MAHNWSLKEIYKDFKDPQIKKDLKALDALIEDLNKKSASMKTDAQFEQVMKDLEEEERLLSKLYAFSGLSEAVDTSNKEASNLKNSVSNISAKSSVIYPRLKKFVADHKDVEGMIKKSAYLQEIAFPIRQMKLLSEYALPEEMEYMAAKLDIDGADAWTNLFELLTSTVEAELPDGSKVTLPVVRSMAMSADPQQRKDAYDAELKCYEKIEKSVASALSAIKGSVLTQVELRKYKSALDMTLMQSNMTKKTLDALIGAIKENLPLLRRFYKAKARLLGHKKGLPFYDLYAPVGETKKYTYAEAKKIILDCFGTFSPALKQCAKDAFDKNWIDLEPKKGKVGGAFCSGLPFIGEFRVLSNFKGNFSDVMTLAHELGHGYHAIVAKDVNTHNLNYPMTLAETASTFCETILYNRFLRENCELPVIEGYLSDITAIIVDIYSRYLFETRVFEERKDAQPKADDFKTYMIEAQKEAYGDGLDPKYLHPYMWACKGHYYSAGLNFYNFPYSFGQMFATGLYSLYQKNPESFVPKYDELLRASGAMSVEDACAIMGINPSTKKFWQSSFDVYKGYIEQFEEMVEGIVNPKHAGNTKAEKEEACTAPKKCRTRKACGTKKAEPKAAAKKTSKKTK